MVGLLVFIRIIFDKNDYLTYIVAAINLAAYSYIFSAIMYDSEKGIEDRINSTGVPDQVINRTRLEVKAKIRIISALLIMIPIIVTLACCSNLMNDLLSILALGTSILDEDISNWIIKSYPLTSKK